MAAVRGLVTGAAGQVGRELVRAAGPGLDLLPLARADLDITDAAAVVETIAAHQTEVVINAAAYTAVDRAEEEPMRAFAVNRDGAANLAAACAEAGIPLVHLSTDYVFNGRKGQPYTEADAPDPLGVYGRSKWEGEEAVRERLDRHLIVRTSWVFSAHPPNFVTTMLRLAQEREVLRVVADQRGCPTAARDVAACALALARRAVTDPETPWGTVHFAGTPAATWHELAEAVVAEAAPLVPVIVERVAPITTTEYPTPAARPPDSRLDGSRLEAAFGIAPPPWRPALRDVVAEVLRS